MQAIEGSTPHRSNVNKEHTKIRRRLEVIFTYYDKVKDKWCPITNFADPDCADARILLRCKYARQVLRVPYPFRLDEDLCYLWGLIAGAVHQREQLEIRVDANQEPVIQEIADRLGITVQITPVQRVRRKKGSKRPPSRYRKIRVRFPIVFRKFLYQLGYDPRQPACPTWVSRDQQLAWLEGYLNSPKLQCGIRRSDGISPRICLYITQNNPDLLRRITAILEQLPIHFSVYCFRERIRIVIQRQASLLKLAKIFTLRRPKARALFAILQECQHEPALRMSLQKFDLDEFQLTLYGVVLDQPPQELSYTLFENTFASSSNEIRHNLYLLDQLGLITYYKKEDHREFLFRTTRYLHQLHQILDQEAGELRRPVKYTDSNAMSFHCRGCDQVVSYIEAMDERSFHCPHCHSHDLHAVELSKFFYYGHLGQLTHQQNVLQGGIA